LNAFPSSAAAAFATAPKNFQKISFFLLTLLSMHVIISMMTAKRRKQILIRLPAETAGRLEIYAHLCGWSVNEAVHRIVGAALEDRRRDIDALLALRRGKAGENLVLD
jgi:hypothetical protein